MIPDDSTGTGNSGGSREPRAAANGFAPDPAGDAAAGVTAHQPTGGSGPAAARSGRFPEWTRDTARPEGGGRAAGGSAPAPARQWPILTVLGGIVLGLIVTAADGFRAGTVLVGISLLVGAVLRWTLPSVGMLAVRSRFTDVITYTVLGTLIVLLALMAQPNPILEIPFLEDIIRFSVR